ncbi:GNAT family N-acetyltransferase [Leeia sp. TBRC 13508]|uniref:GNAT family N-acetyltransferase n=1 Tax=Leeia speluncae TaxID=2884804 RepID=A0ABS8D5G5_9NEIS|nr:GNAT family N-acetyltransferase [Leeia speluncae]MCB6183412.1 GNAT family N-acetyltransferase [Leeia speluncae]
MTIQIRQASLLDIPKIAPLFDAYRQFYEQAPNLSKAAEFLTTLLSQQASIVLIAELEGGEIVGFCQLYHSYCSVIAAPIFILYDLYVTPAHRRLSAARDLMQAAETLAKSLGKARLDLSTAKDNLKAQALYASEGYIRDDVFYVYTKTVDS